MTRFTAGFLAPLFAAALLLGLAAAPGASAASGVKYGLTDDAWLQDGPGTLESRVTTLDSLGVGVVRFTLHWDEIAATKPAAPADPTDPAYDWTADDAVLAGLHSHGILVVLQLVGTPRWANGGLPPNYAPTSATTFRAFASAAAHRYPWVRRWLIWNEPNQVRWLRPTTPAVYTVRLLNPAYAAIHAAIPGAQVAGGGTAPRGSTGGVSPVAWLLGMRAAHARLDAYAHNPYPLDPKRETPLTGGCEHCLTITMATIGKLVALVARNFPQARIWLTEYGYQTDPPDHLLGVSPALQARYVGEGAYVAYRTPRVDLLIHFLYRDEPNVSRFQSGLVTLGNKRKPAFDAFEAPLAQTARTGTHVNLWGQLRAPAAAGFPARLERKVGAAWRLLAALRPSPDGYIRWTGVLPRGAVVRLHAGTIAGAALLIH
ncbi:MAG TPA: hypothetical protein VMU73_00510 [Gaiellaceae bacterium]|nr:hypothetical protein [Gaiellaceae bacterium]